MVSLPDQHHRSDRSLAWTPSDRLGWVVILASCVGLIVWKVVDRHLASLNADKPSLEDLISQVGEENGSKRSWISPHRRPELPVPLLDITLAHQCEGDP